MSSSFRDYETLYGIALLDDLHNYFPALLYEPSRFSTVPQVLAYVQQQTRRRFDLYSFGYEGYQRQAASSPPATGGAGVRYERTGYAVSVDEEQRRQHRQTPLRSFASPIPRPPFNTAVNIHEVDEDDIDTSVFQFLARPAMPLVSQRNPLANQALLRLLLATLEQPNRQVVNSSFMQPVLVAPTADQIERATTLETLESPSENVCPICQDTYVNGAEQRTITHCRHTFHKTCIDTWFQQNVHCPVCRYDIREHE